MSKFDKTKKTFRLNRTKARTCHCLANGFGTVRTICNLFLTVYFDLKVWRISSLFSFSAKILIFSKIKVQVFNSTLKWQLFVYIFEFRGQYYVLYLIFLSNAGDERVQQILLKDKRYHEKNINKTSIFPGLKITIYFYQTK